MNEQVALLYGSREGYTKKPTDFELSALSALCRIHENLKNYGAYGVTNESKWIHARNAALGASSLTMISANLLRQYYTVDPCLSNRPVCHNSYFLGLKRTVKSFSLPFLLPYTLNKALRT